jgi:prevent-host-death family protein
MVTRVTATVAKAKLLALLDAVERGEEIEITRRGKPVARLTPARGPHALKGMFKGLAWTTDPDDHLYTTGVEWTFDEDNLGDHGPA